MLPKSLIKIAVLLVLYVPWPTRTVRVPVGRVGGRWVWVESEAAPY